MPDGLGLSLGLFDFSTFSTILGRTPAVFDMLEQLYLGGTGFDDQGLSFIREFPNLSVLDLLGTNVSGRSIDFLLNMPGLRTVYLTGSKYSKDDIDVLRQKSPLLNVIYEE